MTEALTRTTEPPSRLPDSHVREETKWSDFKWVFTNSFDKMRSVCRDATRSENLGNMRAKNLGGGREVRVGPKSGRDICPHF